VRIEAGDLIVVGHVDGQGEVADAVVAQVDADHRGALLAEAARGLGADPARRAGDDADLALQSSHRLSLPSRSTRS
jgi:hypothetical protein